jgi:hypothetical protein
MLPQLAIRPLQGHSSAAALCCCCIVLLLHCNCCRAEAAASAHPAAADRLEADNIADMASSDSHAVAAAATMTSGCSSSCSWQKQRNCSQDPSCRWCCLSCQAVRPAIGPINNRQQTSQGGMLQCSLSECRLMAVCVALEAPKCLHWPMPGAHTAGCSPSWRAWPGRQHPVWSGTCAANGSKWQQMHVGSNCSQMHAAPPCMSVPLQHPVWEQVAELAAVAVCVTVYVA